MTIHPLRAVRTVAGRERLLRVAAWLTLPVLVVYTTGFVGVLTTRAASAEVDRSRTEVPLVAGAGVHAQRPLPLPNPPLRATCGLDMGLVIDSSGSVNGTELGQLKTAFKGFVDAFLPGTPTLMSVVEFDTNVVPPTLPFTNNVTALKNRIDASMSGGFTNWEDPLDEMRNQFDPRPAKFDLVLFASDGNPNTVGTTPPSNGGGASEIQAVDAAILKANAIKAEGIRVLALGIGGDLDVDNLKAISGPNVDTGDATTSDVITTDFESMAQDLADLANDLCGGKILVQKQFDTDGDGIADIDGSVPNPLLAGWTFDVDGTPSNPIAQTTSNTGALEFSVLNGTYSVTETNQQPNTVLSSADCQKGGQPVGTFDPQTRTITGLVMGTDQTISCTFINSTTLGTLQVIKQVIGGADQPSDWNIHVQQNGADVPGSPQPGSPTGTEYQLTTGNYTVLETDGPDGYTLSYSSECVNGVAQVSAGQMTTCTLTNTRDTGSVTINKKVDANGDGTFEGGNVEGNALGFRWGLDNGSVDQQMGSTVNGIPTGPHTVTENAIPGYHFVGWYSDGPNTLPTPVGCAYPQGTTLPVDITVVDGGITSITLCNARDTAGLTVKKAVDTDGDGDVDIADDSTWTWDLDGGNQNYQTGSTQTVVTGMHEVSEDNQGGYHNMSWSCWNAETQDPLGNGSGTSLDVSVPLDGVTCLFTNARDVGTITVNKEFDDDGDGSSDRVNPEGWTWDLVNGAQDNAGGSTLILPTDSYTAREDAIGGYASSWECSNEQSGSGTEIPFALNYDGHHVTCTFFNVRNTGSIVVHKQIDADANGVFESGNTEANDLGFRWGFDGIEPDRPMGSSAAMIPTGEYAVNENDIPGYHFVGWYPNDAEHDCTEPYSTERPATLNVEDDSTTSITFCNVRDTGTLTILKNVDTDGDGDVDVFGSGDWTWDVMNGPQNTATGSSQTLVTGPYTVSEDQQPGYHVTDFSCGETSFGAVEEIGVTLTNADLTCTFTNALTVTTIGLTKSAPATTVPGGQLVYALGWSVNGNSSATNATIEDALPANTTFVSADCGTTIGTCSAVNLAGTVTWSLGTRSPGENGTVTLTVAVTNPLANGMTIPNLATFDTSETGPVEANATTTVVSAPILTIEKSVDVSFVNPGKTATYTVVITNTGNDTAHNVILTDALPAGLVFTEGGGVTKTFAIGELAPGASTSVRYDVSVAGDLAPGFYDNLATVKADNDDPISDTARLEVRAPAVLSGEAQPELRIKKTVDRDLTNPGATLLYTVTVKNIGEAIAENVKIVDQLPNGLSFVSNSETNHTWKLGDIPAGESRAVTYKVKVNSSVKSGTYTNIATASARDLNPVSDEANVDVRIPAVLGAETALPETGFGGLDWMITFFLLVCISVGLGLLLQPVTDESALER